MESFLLSGLHLPFTLLTFFSKKEFSQKLWYMRNSKVQGRLIRLRAIEFIRNRQPLCIPWWADESFFYNGKIVSPILFNFCLEKKFLIQWSLRQLLVDINRKNVLGDIVKELCTSEADSTRCTYFFNHKQKTSLSNFHV